LRYTYAVVLEKRVGALEGGSGINPEIEIGTSDSPLCVSADTLLVQYTYCTYVRPRQ
jgi:hypothetical protein